MGVVQIVVSFLVFLIPAFFIAGTFVILLALASVSASIAERRSRFDGRHEQPASAMDELEAWYARQMWQSKHHRHPALLHH